MLRNSISVYPAAPGYVHLDIPQELKLCKFKTKPFIFTHLHTSLLVP